ncbi:MAG: SurA N-terminal domain-containing protein [Anaerolineae bacterium]|nr:SurA N-terminal domain-containing protein [Anaerolineae bacterium]
MSKKIKQGVTPRSVTRKEQSRLEREAKMNRWLIGSSIAIGVLVVGVLLYGFIFEEVIKGREPVAMVNDTPIRTADWQARVLELRERMTLQLNTYSQQRMALDPNDPNAAAYFEQLDQQIRQLQDELAAENAVELGRTMLEQMAQEEIFRQEAARLGLTVSEEEIDQAVEQLFGFDREAAESSLLPSDTLTPTQSVMTEEEFETQYQNYLTMVLKPSGISEEGFRDMIEASLLGQKVEEEIGSSVPTVADQVHLRIMSFQFEEEAAEIMGRLNDGEDWDAIVTELEESEESTVYASDLDWQTQGLIAEQFGDSVAQRIFESEIGSYGGPFPGSIGFYYIIQVLEHEERELDEFILSYEQGLVFQEWLEVQMETVEYIDGWQEKVPTGSY